MKPTNSSIRFQSEVLEGFLRKIYDGFNINEEIEPSLWREFLRHFNEASAEGIIESEHLTHEERFLSNLKHSNEVFSAFKSHSMGVRMQERLRDEEGKLRSFKDWARSVAPIAQHHVGAWLKTEYDTAILRAHQASDWQEFERNRDILPNLRWMPTTSPSPENIHEGFWSMRLTLPVNDPFWEEHHPANRWNCKCSLEATSDSPQAPMSEQPSTAQCGLDENPRHGRTFSDKHPYFPKSCKACPYYTPKKGLANQLKELWNKREKDCYNCPHVDQAIEQAKESRGQTLKERAKEILEGNTIYLNDKEEVFPNLKTEHLYRDKKPLRRLLNHCRNHRVVDAALDMWANPQKLKFVRESPFGEGKDLKNEKAQKNLEGKRKRGVIAYNEYLYDYDGKEWIVKLEVHRKGFEQAYFIGEKRKQK